MIISILVTQTFNPVISLVHNIFVFSALHIRLLLFPKSNTLWSKVRTRSHTHVVSCWKLAGPAIPGIKLEIEASGASYAIIIDLPHSHRTTSPTISIHTSLRNTLEIGCVLLRYCCWAGTLFFLACNLTITLRRNFTYQLIHNRRVFRQYTRQFINNQLILHFITSTSSYFHNSTYNPIHNNRVLRQLINNSLILHFRTSISDGHY